jgi:SH3-like domain-containing protein
MDAIYIAITTKKGESVVLEQFKTQDGHVGYTPIDELKARELLTRGNISDRLGISALKQVDEKLYNYPKLNLGRYIVTADKLEQDSTDNHVFTLDTLVSKVPEFIEAIIHWYRDTFPGQSDGVTYEEISTRISNFNTIPKYIDVAGLEIGRGVLDRLFNQHFGPEIEKVYRLCSQMQGPPFHFYMSRLNVYWSTALKNGIKRYTAANAIDAGEGDVLITNNFADFLHKADLAEYESALKLVQEDKPQQTEEVKAKPIVKETPKPIAPINPKPDKAKILEMRNVYTQALELGNRKKYTDAIAKLAKAQELAIQLLKTPKQDSTYYEKIEAVVTDIGAKSNSYKEARSIQEKNAKYTKLEEVKNKAEKTADIDKSVSLFREALTVAKELKEDTEVYHIETRIKQLQEEKRKILISPPIKQKTAKPDPKARPIAERSKSNRSPYILIAILLLCLSGVGYWFYQYTHATETIEKSGYIAADTDANIRLKPGKENPAVAMLARGDSIYVVELDKKSNWYKVRFGKLKEEGYVSGKLVGLMRPTDIQPINEMWQIVEDVELKQSATPDSPTIAELSKNNEVKVLFKNLSSNWLRIEYNGIKGHIKEGQAKRLEEDIPKEVPEEVIPINESCEYCFGSGKTTCESCKDGIISIEIECRRCENDSLGIKDKCPSCSGNGCGKCYGGGTFCKSHNTRTYSQHKTCNGTSKLTCRVCKGTGKN